MNARKKRRLRAERDAHFSELAVWVQSRPANVAAVMDVFPPAAYVVAKDGRRLFCPAPGQRAMIERYLEDDAGRVTLGVVPVDDPFPACGYVECDPDWLAVVDSQEQFDLYRAAQSAALPEEPDVPGGASVGDTKP